MPKSIEYVAADSSEANFVHSLVGFERGDNAPENLAHRAFIGSAPSLQGAHLAHHF
ncbi:MAG: hypothetical protein ABR949_10245 [Candidatus Aquilonibacter sp.]